MEHREVITNDEIAHILTEFKNAVERGEAYIVVGQHYVAFIGNGEVILEHDEFGFFVKVKTNNYRLVTDAWDMFVCRGNKHVIVSPRLALGNETFTTDTFVDYIRKGFRTLLRAASWV